MRLKGWSRAVEFVTATRNNNRKNHSTLIQYPGPFQRIGADFFEFQQKQYLITVDFFSGWFEIDLLPSQITNRVVQKLKSQMSRYGIPYVLVTDNGPQFDSYEFKQFQNRWGFHHITSSPYYPQSNGGTERAAAVQSAKALMKKAREAGEVEIILLNHRNTPRDEVLGSPAQRLMSRGTKKSYLSLKNSYNLNQRRPELSKNVYSIIESST